MDRGGRADRTPTGRAAARTGGGEQGIALVLALVMISLLGIVGTMALSTSTIELQIAGNYRNMQWALYAADSGTEFGQVSRKIYEDVGTRIPEGLRTEWSGTEMLAGLDPADPTVDVDLRAQWVSCRPAPTIAGTETESVIGGGGSSVPNNANYYIIDVVGRGPNGSQARVETQVARIVANCP